MCTCLYDNFNWTAAAAIGNFLMVAVTYWSIRESQKQWRESRRARVIISVVFANEAFLLRLENIGDVPAHIKKISFNRFFTEDLMSKQSNMKFRDLAAHGIHINAKTSKYYEIHPSLGLESSNYTMTHEFFGRQQISEWYQVHKSDEMKVSCQYQSIDDETLYTETFVSALESHFGSLIVCDNEVDAILQVNKSLKNLSKQLDKIDKKI